MRNYNFHYSTMLSFVVILIISLAPLDSNATLSFEIERVSDTKANITGTGILDTAEPTGAPNIFSFKNPFGIAPPSIDNRIIDDDGSTLQIGFPTVDIAWMLGSGMAFAGGDPWIYIGKSRGSYVPGSTVTGSLSITLPSGITFAAPGSTGLVNWGVGTDGIDAGTWTMVSSSILTYSVGGTVSDLTGSVTLQNNSSDDIIKTTNDGFTFPAQAEGTDYAVTVSSQPVGQTCTVGNGSGTNITANVTNVTVTCVTDVIPTYSVGGNVSGLTGTGLALQNNGADTLAVAGDGPFTFVTELTDGAAYAVTVSTQPTGQTCSVTDGSSTVATADINNVSVACVDDVAPPAPVDPIPTMSQWALILLSTLLGLMVFVNRRRLF